MKERRLIASFVLRLLDGRVREYELIDLRTGEQRSLASLAELVEQLRRWSRGPPDEPDADGSG